MNHVNPGAPFEQLAGDCLWLVAGVAFLVGMVIVVLIGVVRCALHAATLAAKQLLP